MEIRQRGPRSSTRSRRLGQAGTVHDDTTEYSYPTDTSRYGAFERGRDFEGLYTNHKYTAQEQKILGCYESFDYLPPHSEVYKNWLRRQPRRLDWDRWVVMALIGTAVGLIGFLLQQVIVFIEERKLDILNEFLKHGRILQAYGASLAYSLLFILLATVAVVFLQPAAAGSGIPELTGFLNGTIVPKIFNVKTLFVKFFSCCCAVGSGMPVGPEGPMIHMGSLVGAGLSQFKSETLRFRLPFFQRFRNPEDRRNFISAGAAAGVASAFGAPVGGLLFSMEEVSSFWNLKLTWQIFFCCMIATVITDLFQSSFSGFHYRGGFGAFRVKDYIKFSVSEDIPVNILLFLPTVLLGAVGGLFGSIFTFINLKFARLRSRVHSLLHKRPNWQKLLSTVEPAIILILYITLSTFLPALFKCTHVLCMPDDKVDKAHTFACAVNTTDRYYIGTHSEPFTCGKAKNSTSELVYNQAATLFLSSGEETVRHLFRRRTHLQFDYPALLTMLPVYFLLACWSAGTAISSGLMVPMLLIGGLYGRLLGVCAVYAFGLHSDSEKFDSWIDPGAFALIGAASFMGGVSKLTISLTVIMLEITNDVKFLLPIMVAIMVAKWVGDYFTHPLFHALLELKCIPFLHSEPIVYHHGQVVNLELYSAKNVMSEPVIALELLENVTHVATLLLNTNHGAFPVQRKINDVNVFYGLITRMELISLMCSQPTLRPLKELTAGDKDDCSCEVTHIDYDRLQLDKLRDPVSVMDMLETFIKEAEKYSEQYISLHPFVNTSAMTLREDFSLHRTYIIFRSLGLRHITVVDTAGRVAGIITRKDLMGFRLEQKIHSLEEPCEN